MTHWAHLHPLPYESWIYHHEDHMTGFKIRFLDLGDRVEVTTLTASWVLSEAEALVRLAEMNAPRAGGPVPLYFYPLRQMLHEYARRRERYHRDCERERRVLNDCDWSEE